jgi:hypothetical protein
MNENEQNGPRPKRRYKKPAVQSIGLRAEEAVLGNCKGANTKGPNSPGNNCRPIGYCVTQSS